MRKKSYRVVLVLLPLLVCCACSTIPKDIRKEAVDVSFSKVMKDADRYMGKTVIWGGYILKVENMENQTRILVLQSPLTSRNEPKSREQSKGRFMAVFKEFLDPEIYKVGREVTVAGTITGQVPFQIGDYTYPLPRIDGKFIQLWLEPDRTGYNYYPPYYYDPFWDSPFYRHYWGPHPYYW